MIRLLKNFLILILIINFIGLTAFAIEFDTSINEEIRKNYNPNKIEEDMTLPDLPKILNSDIENQKNDYTSKPKAIVKSSTKPAKITKNVSAIEGQNYYAVLKKGTKIKVKLLNSVYDSSGKGTKLSLISLYPVTTTYFTIPSGTSFKGTVASSHKPQFTANGGLIKIRIDGIFLNNELQPVNAYVTKTDSKKIFFNNVKGKRKYVKSVIKSMEPGFCFFKKMLHLSGNLAKDGSSIVVAPFSLAVGALVIGCNIAVSPAMAVFYKGEHVKLEKGSILEIKLVQDMFIYK